VSCADEAALHRAALLLGLIRGEDVIRWADDRIAHDASAPPGLFEVSTTSPDDLTALRERLFAIGGNSESADVVRRLLVLVQRDLTSGRRSLHDTMTVLKQLRAFIKVDRGLNEQLKTLGVDVFMSHPGTEARAAAEQRVRDWLKQYE
jgi:hypothetical protein